MDTPEQHAKHMARLRMWDRLIIIGGFTLMIAGLGYLHYCTMVIHRLQAQLAAMVARF